MPHQQPIAQHQPQPPQQQQPQPQQAEPQQYHVAPPAPMAVPAPVVEEREPVQEIKQQPAVAEAELISFD